MNNLKNRLCNVHCTPIVFNMREKQMTILVETVKYTYQVLNKIEKFNNFVAEIHLVFAN